MGAINNTSVCFIESKNNKSKAEVLTTDKIPDFADSKYQNLIEALKNGTCVFFGAGVSKIAGYRL